MASTPRRRLWPFTIGLIDDVVVDDDELQQLKLINY